MLCIIVHYLLPKLRKNPGQLVLLQCYFELINDINLTLSAGLYKNYLKVIPCMVISIIASTSVLLSFFYNLIVAFEVYTLTKHRTITKHSKRARLYYSLSTVLSVVLFLMSLLTNSYGENSESACLLKNDSFLDYLHRDRITNSGKKLQMSRKFW